ncbi:MAG TPA: phosphotransferase [Pyrinomonadaceae bacterium]|nr:phosphotransferase [Pyrinomonadaceae bacterium]
MSLADELYNLQSTAESLPSERDQNFLLTDASGQRFVLKVANSHEDEALLQAQADAMMLAGERLSFCQRLVPNVHGQVLTRVTSETGESNLIRLVTYLPGVALGVTEVRSAGLLSDLGNKLAQLDTVLLDFDHGAIHRDFHWDLAKWETVITSYSELISDPSLRNMILTYAGIFETTAAPLLPGLRLSVIHGDTNDYNILINDERSEVVGIIDFGDMVYSYTVADLAIGLAYVVLNNDSPIAAAANVIRGYHQVFPLRDGEIAVVWALMIMRLCMSVCIATYQQQQRPDNEYLDISQQAIRERLPSLLQVSQRDATSILLGTLND